jgi:hypothetical protein
MENLAYSCQGCNNFKYNHTEAIDPGSGIKVPLFNPRKQFWPEHFGWDENYSIVVGLSPSGRATVERLKLNREGVINLRISLFKENLHPPPIHKVNPEK